MPALDLSRINTELILGFLSSFGADFVSSLFFKGSPEKTSLLQKAKDFLAKGEKAEAEKMIKASFLGLGLADEWIMGYAILWVASQIDGRHLTQAQFNGFMVWLNSKGERVWKRFRYGLVNEPSEDRRFQVLARLARLNNNERDLWLANSGWLDRSVWEKVDAQLKGGETYYNQQAAQYRERNPDRTATGTTAPARSIWQMIKNLISWRGKNW